MQRLEKSDRIEDREKAKILAKALEEASKANTDNKFAKLLDLLRSDRALTSDDVEKIASQDEYIAQDMREILKILLTDDRDAQLAREIAETTRLLERLKEVIRAQAQTRHGVQLAVARGEKDDGQLGRQGP